MRTAIVLTATLVSCGFGLSASAQQADMTFFITSAGSGKGGDLGGLAGADAHCQALAQAAGAGTGDNTMPTPWHSPSERNSYQPS